jgi:hypothetical protein
MLKTQSPPIEPSLMFLIFISLFGLALSFVFVITAGGTPDDFGLRKPLVGSVFGALCVLGTFASIYPDSCSRIFDYEKRMQHEKASGKLQGPTIGGHHPACGNYSAHILRVGNRIFCATCTGFSVGAIIALIGVGLLFFGPFRFGTRPFIPLIIGAFGVAIGLLHSILPGFRVGFSRFIASAFFATGSFLILASAENALRNTSIDLFFVLLSVLWLVTDTALSRWDHRRICSKCASESCGANSN